MADSNAGHRVSHLADLRTRMVRVACASLVFAGLSAMTDVIPVAADEHTSRAASESFTRIVGGTEARKDTWPWQVAVLLLPQGDNAADQRWCGGTVIAPRLGAERCPLL